VKKGTLDHWKTLALASALHMHGRYRVGGLLEALWHFTAAYCPNGQIGQIPPAALAAWIGYPDGPRLLKALTETRWIDGTGAEARIHDWPQHCEDSVHMKLARAHQWFADGSAPKLTRLGRAERLAARAFFSNGKDKDATAKPTTTSKPDLRPQPPNPCLEILTECLRQNELPGSERMLDWASKHQGPPLTADWCWRLIAYGRQVQRQVVRGGVHDPARMWIALCQRAKFAPPDRDYRDVQKMWSRVERQLHPDPPTLDRLVKGIGGQK
jgi:hypothetical protein